MKKYADNRARDREGAMKAHKVLTHDLCSPIQGGDPIWDGSLPYQLPTVRVDRSDDDCAVGWNACRDLSTALRISGLWPNGRPSRAFEVDSVPRRKITERGDKLRASSWRFVRECSDVEIENAIREWTATWAGPVTDEMVREQMAWRVALGRPSWDPDAVDAGLRAALDARGLGEWRLRRFESSRAAWDARAAWAAWDARVARAAWDARDAWAAWDSRAARDAGDARDAWDALTVHHAAVRRWTSHRPDLLTAGIRDAYAFGMAGAIPTASYELGWVMEDTNP